MKDLCYIMLYKCNRLLSKHSYMRTCMYVCICAYMYICIYVSVCISEWLVNCTDDWVNR